MNSWLCFDRGKIEQVGVGETVCKRKWSQLFLKRKIVGADLRGKNQRLRLGYVISRCHLGGPAGILSISGWSQKSEDPWQLWILFMEKEAEKNRALGVVKKEHGRCVAGNAMSGGNEVR